MRIRIATDGNKYLGEIRFGLFYDWYKLPKISKFRAPYPYSYSGEDILYFDFYEKARILIDEYILKFSMNRNIVYTEIKA